MEEGNTHTYTHAYRTDTYSGYLTKLLTHTLKMWSEQMALEPKGLCDSLTLAWLFVKLTLALNPIGE